MLDKKVIVAWKGMNSLGVCIIKYKNIVAKLLREISKNKRIYKPRKQNVPESVVKIDIPMPRTLKSRESKFFMLKNGENREASFTNLEEDRETNKVFSCCLYNFKVISIHLHVCWEFLKMYK